MNNDMLPATKAVAFAQDASYQAMLDSCDSIIPMAAYIEVYEAAQQVRKIAASRTRPVESP